jgi:hypothetical protein
MDKGLLAFRWNLGCCRVGTVDRVRRLVRVQHALELLKVGCQEAPLLAKALQQLPLLRRPGPRCEFLTFLRAIATLLRVAQHGDTSGRIGWSGQPQLLRPAPRKLPVRGGLLQE